MKRHQLKCHTDFFWSVVDGSKPFEIRWNDREYQVGDILDLHEWDGEDYTGFGTTVCVTYMTSFAQEPGYVVMGIKPAMDESGAIGGVCRVCGCTDDDCSGCIERTGEPCHWIEPDLCSACSSGVKA